MPDNSRILRIPETLRIAKEIERTRDICLASVELLKVTTPDTFLGRETTARVEDESPRTEKSPARRDALVWRTCRHIQ